MEMTISKTDFEKSLPVGASAHDEVYESVKPAIDGQLRFARTALLGTEGEAYLETLGEDSVLMEYVKRLICVSAFLSVMRQLDLVLTPTGFGIVSNQNVSPASKQRVDALEADLKTLYHKTLAVVLFFLRGADWGGTAQAKHFIAHLYDEYAFFYFLGSDRQKTAQEWKDFQSSIEGADELLREKMSDAQMDDMLDAYRKNDQARLDKYGDMINHVVNFTNIYAALGYGVLKEPVFRRIMRTIDSEDNAETFALYRASSNYKANHHDVYQNSKDSSGYVFNG